VQAKLTIGAPDDKYEREADRIADEVMRMPEPCVQRTGICPECEEDRDEFVQTKPLADQITPLVQRQIEPQEEEEEGLQAKSRPGAPPAVTPSLEARINSLRGGGQSLDTATRNFFETRIGHDLSQVRVHHGAQTAKIANSINARAFTLGNNLVFGSGQYQPQSSEGKQLLGHELTHVVQQGEGLTSGKVHQQESNKSDPIDSRHVGNHSLFQRLQRLTDPLSDMSTFQSPGSSGWWGATWGCYRSNCTKKHKGWDIHASVGSECKATVAGTTSHASESGGYGDYVILTSSADATKKYIYAHMGSRETVGTVAEGAKVGEVGTSGNASSTRPHLHFTVKESGAKVDPDGKGFTKPTKVIEASGTTATTYNSADPEPCTPCTM
jgi:murein DD-endopeptidase MepM/ murein hydrolase activator NlpD